jgi:hypothetical protein
VVEVNVRAISLRSMAKPTVDDAIELLTDPGFRAPGQPSDARFIHIAGNRVLAELQNRGASEEQAQGLVQQALRQLGGEDLSRDVPFEETGGPTVQRDYVYAIPRERMRE